jgi:acetyl esterase
VSSPNKCPVEPRFGVLAGHLSGHSKEELEVADEGVLDPWVKKWMAQNPMIANPLDEFTPEILELARGPVGAPPTREIAHINDEGVGDVAVRIYRSEEEPTGIVVYFHGGGFVLGSIGLMDNVARELTYASGAVVISVEYRLAPENPYPAGLDDCMAVSRWAVANAKRFGVPAGAVAVAGESAGGNLAAAVSLKLRDEGDAALAGQVLIYPATAGSRATRSREQFDGLVINLKASDYFWNSYAAGRDLDSDPYAAPLSVTSLVNLPPALVVLGGCDMLRDEGRQYAALLRDGGVPVEEVCYPGQPHGFVNFEFPAAVKAFELIGRWLRQTLVKPDGS